MNEKLEFVAIGVGVALFLMLSLLGARSDELCSRTYDPDTRTAKTVCMPVTSGVHDFLFGHAAEDTPMITHTPPHADSAGNPVTEAIIKGVEGAAAQ